MRGPLICALALFGCIEDRAASDDPGDPVDGGRIADRGPRADRGPFDAGPIRDAAPVIDAGPPPNCDQPDPGSCEVANCAWSDFVGCYMPRGCPFDEATCGTVEGCEWGPDPIGEALGCWPAEGSTCDGWRQSDCRRLVRCLVVQGACVPAIDAPCDQIAPTNCWRSASCVSEFDPDCADQPKQQEPPREADAGPQPEPEAPPPECFGPGECADGDWCRNAFCVSCEVPVRCVDQP